MSEEYYCNICSDKIENHVIRLKCNPDKHYFCEGCITDWYKELKNNKYKYMYNSENEYLEHLEIFKFNLQRTKSYFDEKTKRHCKIYLTKFSDLTTNSLYDYDTCKDNSFLKKVKLN